MPESQAPPRLRVFVAISLPEEVQAKIVEVQKELRRDATSASIRWASAEQLHLTLKFLGSVDLSRIEVMCAGIREACRVFRPLRLRAAGLGFFPRPSSPRVLWVGVSDQEKKLPDLHQAIQKTTLPFTSEPPEKRPFAGHVTLARIKEISHAQTETLVRATDRHSAAQFGEWVSGEIHLIRSELSPHGSRYTPLEHFPLSGT